MSKIWGFRKIDSGRLCSGLGICPWRCRVCVVAKAFQGVRSCIEAAEWTSLFRFDLICIVIPMCLSPLFLRAYCCQLSGSSLVALKCSSPFPCFVIQHADSSMILVCGYEIRWHIESPPQAIQHTRGHKAQPQGKRCHLPFHRTMGGLRSVRSTCVDL